MWGGKVSGLTWTCREEKGKKGTQRYGKPMVREPLTAVDNRKRIPLLPAFISSHSPLFPPFPFASLLFSSSGDDDQRGRRHGATVRFIPISLLR